MAHYKAAAEDPEMEPIAGVTLTALTIMPQEPVSPLR
jgi:hypothetical protein